MSGSPVSLEVRALTPERADSLAASRRRFLRGANQAVARHAADFNQPKIHRLTDRFEKTINDSAEKLLIAGRTPEEIKALFCGIGVQLAMQMVTPAFVRAAAVDFADQILRANNSELHGMMRSLESAPYMAVLAHALERAQEPSHVSPSRRLGNLVLDSYRATAQERFLGNDSALWTMPGDVRKYPDGTLKIILPDGITRLEYPGNQKQIHGLTLNGSPVVHTQMDNGDEIWDINPDFLAEKMLNSAKQRVRVTTFKTPDSPDTIYSVFSQTPLSAGQLKHIRTAVSELPPRLLDGFGLFFVFPVIGESLKKTGEILPLGGETSVESAKKARMFLTAFNLKSQTRARRQIFHEAMHILDYKHAPECHSDHDGVFGAGTLREREDGQIDLGQSSFASRHASINAREDFAVCGEVLLEARRVFNAAHPGQEFLAIGEPEQRRIFLENKLSDDLTKKLLAQVEILLRL